MEHAQWVGENAARFHEFVAELGPAVRFDERNEAARLPGGWFVGLEFLVLAASVSTDFVSVEERHRS